MDLREEMRNGFADLRTENATTNAKIDLLAEQIKTQYDERYTLAKDEMAQAQMRLLDPTFRAQCMQIGNDWAKTEEGKSHVRSIFSECLNSGRDSAIKWYELLKIAGGLIVVGFMLYGGNTIFNNQKAIENSQKVMTTLIENNQKAMSALVETQK